VTIFAQGKQHEWIVEGTKKDAKSYEARMRLDLAARPPSQRRGVPTFSAFCAESYRPHAETHLAGSTWRKVRIYQVATLCEHFGATRLDDLTNAVLESFKQARVAAKVRASSINNELRVLKTMLRWGREQLALPILELKFKMMPKDGKRRVRTWSGFEVQRLYAAAREEAPHLVSMMHFLLDTGCRKGEMLAAEWSWVDLPGRILRIPVTDEWRPKDKQAREVPLSGALLTTLRSMPHASDRYIFPNRHGVRDETFPEKSFRRVVKAAQLGGGPHTTRHTYASHFLKAQPDLPLLAAVLGHSQTYVTELYAHLLPEHLDRARDAVQLAPTSEKVWRQTLARPSKTQETSSKTHLRH
jgi:integrase